MIPSRFILTTDFATYKNDADKVLKFTVPGSIVVPPNTDYSEFHDIDVGTAGAPVRSFINSSASPNDWFYGSSLYGFADGTLSVSGPNPYNFSVFVTRSGPQTVRVYFYVYGDYTTGQTLTTEPTARTISVGLSTFLPPFPS